MTTIVQQNSLTSGFGTSPQSASFTSTITNGNSLTLLVWISSGSGTGLTITDDKSNVYTLDGTYYSAGRTTYYYLYHCSNITNSPTKITGSWSGGGSGQFEMCYVEWNGLVNTNPFDNFIAQIGGAYNNGVNTWLQINASTSNAALFGFYANYSAVTISSNVGTNVNVAYGTSGYNVITSPNLVNIGYQTAGVTVNAAMGCDMIIATYRTTASVSANGTGRIINGLLGATANNTGYNSNVQTNPVTTTGGKNSMYLVFTYAGAAIPTPPTDNYNNTYTLLKGNTAFTAPWGTVYPGLWMCKDPSGAGANYTVNVNMTGTSAYCGIGFVEWLGVDKLNFVTNFAANTTSAKPWLGASMVETNTNAIVFGFGFDNATQIQGWVHSDGSFAAGNAICQYGETGPTVDSFYWYPGITTTYQPNITSVGVTTTTGYVSILGSFSPSILTPIKMYSNNSFQSAGFIEVASSANTMKMYSTNNDVQILQMVEVSGTANQKLYPNGTFVSAKFIEQ